jgi:hypothetical protein
MEGNSSVSPIFSDEAAVDQIIADADVLDPVDAPNDEVHEVHGAEELGETSSELQDIPGEEEQDQIASGGTARKPSVKAYYNIIAVQGAAMPSENARFSGSSPSGAAKKVAKKVWNKTGKKSFSVLMRKVSQQVAGRTLYKYEMSMVKMADPVAFINVPVAKFKRTNGKVEHDVIKHVKVVRMSSDPVYGYIDGSGSVVQGTSDESGQGTLHRAPDNDGLAFNIGTKAPYPSKIGTLKVNRTDWEPKFKRVDPTEAEVIQHDVAGAHKKSAKDAEVRNKEKLREKNRKAKSKSSSKASKSSSSAK